MNIPASCYITTWDEVYEITKKMPNGPRSKEQFFEELERIKGSLNRIGIGWLEVRPLGRCESYVIIGSTQDIANIEAEF